MLDQVDPVLIEEAAKMIRESDIIMIGAGAGMGVDSGLPDFRGTEGFWRAYPPLKELGLSFRDVANPKWFRDDHSLAWGFYGHRLNLYRKTLPHQGFAILKKWVDARSEGFVFTSNVDGQFQRAGFDPQKIIECHGSILHLQCSRPCRSDIWEAKETEISIDPATSRAQAPFPACPHCGALARPNILMFGDRYWIADRSEAQERSFTRWISRMGERNSEGRTVIIEMGAGGAIPTVRWQCQDASVALNATFIRINPRESEGPEGTISIAAGALETLSAIDALLNT